MRPPCPLRVGNLEDNNVLRMKPLARANRFPVPAECPVLGKTTGDSGLWQTGGQLSRFGVKSPDT